MKRWTALLLALMLCLSLFPIGASAAEFGDVKYEISDGEVTITGVTNFELRDLDIPAEIEGLPVTSVAMTASSSIGRIKIPSTVKRIADETFEYAYNIKIVYYGGTEEDWKQIDFGSGNSNLTTAETFYYSYTGSLPKQFSLRLSGDLDKSIISNGVLINDPPEGMSFDAENYVITLDHFQVPDTSIWFSWSSSEQEPVPVALKLIGENTVSVIHVETTPNAWLHVTGDGTLNVEQMNVKNLVMDSGTLNVKWNDSGLSYGIYNEGFKPLEAEEQNYFRFLGGVVNVEAENLPEGWQFVGIDVQSGNVEIRNAEVHINLGDYKGYGIGVGWTSTEHYYGGTLTMENGTLEITNGEYQAYFYDLKNEGNPLHYYIGTDGPEQEVSFDEAFQLKNWINYNGDSRYERKTDGKGYLLITDKTVEVQPPKVTPTPTPTAAPVPTAAPTAKPTATPAPTAAPTAKPTAAPAPTAKPTATPAPTAKPDSKNPFKDVSKDQYYYEPVLWAVKNGITQGTSATTFSPAATCTRGQVVTFLWRAAGEPKPTVTKNPYTDVKSSDYFYNAVLWAAEHEITRGTSETTFSPNDPCTRAHVVTFLWRSEGLHAADRESPFTDIDHFDYFYDAVIWAVKQGITQGTSATTFSPNAPCTRGQIVTFLYRDKK